MPVTSSNDLRLITDFLSESLPFDELELAELDRIATQLVIQYQRSGDALNVETCTPGLRILRSGAVELMDEQDKLIERAAEGESFNLHGINEDRPGVNAEFIEDSLVYFLPMADYQALRKSHNHIDRYFDSQRGRRVRKTDQESSTPEYLNRHLSTLMSSQLVSAKPDNTVQEVALIMGQRRVSSALILDGKELKGIITDRDLRSRVVARNYPFTKPVCDVMTPSPLCMQESDSVFDATLFMTEQGIHHIPIQNSDLELVGMITASDLMLVRQNDPVYLVTHIKRQRTVKGLAEICEQLPQLMSQWISSGGRAHQVSRILTAISDGVTRRLIDMAVDELGPPPASFAWLGFGSQGRGEQLLGADQDNGLLLSDSVKEEHGDYFETLAHRVCDGLDACGFPYCPGKIMATTDQWRQPLAGWKNTVDSWTKTPTKDAVMRVSIFFDLRCIYGDEDLTNALQDHMLERCDNNSIFIAALAENVLDAPAPLGLFRQFVVERSGEHRSELNLKLRAVAIIVDIARIHALANGTKAINTYARFKDLMNQKVLAASDARNLQDAWNVIMQIRCEHQAEQVAKGETPSNYVNPDRLSKLVKRQLRDAFSVISDAEQGVSQRYRPGLGR